jgi:hypothetical protein
MSVAIYSEQELNGLYQAMTDNGADRFNTSNALTTAAIANRLAYNRTYEEKVFLPSDYHVPTMADTYVPVPDWTVYQWVRNLLYNCVSNGGTDFCPPKTREYLETTAQAMPAKPIVPEPIRAPEPAPVDFDTVNDWTKAIKAALHKRTRTRFSVTHGTGTAYGWINICVAKSSKNPQADAAELRALLGAENDWRESYSVPASRQYRQEYYARAKGETPAVYGTPYWD